MHAESISDVQRVERGERWTLPPYLLWAVVWFGFFLFAANVRVATKLWDPVFRWVFVQIAILEPATGDLGRRAVFGLVLMTYLVVGSLLWSAFERRKRKNRRGTWARSGLAWAILQVSLMILAFLTT